MKNYKIMCKKVAATITTTAATLALVGAMGVADAKNVSASENNVLVINEGVYVESDAEETLTFTAPADGAYYFYSVTEDDFDMMATLVTENGTYENDDNEYTWSRDFLIEATLSEGEECTLTIKEYSDASYATEIWVADVATINSELSVANDGEEIMDYAYAETTVDLSMNIVNKINIPVWSIDGDYSVEWKKVVGDDEVVLDGTSPILTITVDESDFCTDDNGCPYYVGSLLYNGEVVGSCSWFIMNQDDYMEASYSSYYVSMGESVTLEAEAYKNGYYYDYYEEYENEKIDLSNYKVEWYKVSCDPITGEEEETYLGEGLTYTIDSVTEDDIYSYKRGLYNSYRYKIYVSSMFSVEGECDLRDIENEYEWSWDSVYAPVGDSISYTIYGYDYYGELVDLSPDEFTIEWTKYDDESESYVVVGTDMTLTIDSVTEEDYGLYNGNVYKNGMYVGSCTYIVFDAAEYIGTKDETHEVLLGDSITLTAKLVDYYGNEIEVEDCTYEWMKVVGDRYTTVSTEKSYTIDKIRISDIYNETQHSNYYECWIETPDDFYTVCFYLNKGEEVTTVEPSTEAPTTKAPETTTVAPTTKAPETTTVAPTTASQEVKAPAKAKVKKVVAKKKASKAVKVTLKKINGADGYQVQVSKAKKFKNKNILVKKDSKKLKVTLKNKKLKNKNKLYVRARAYAVDANGNKVYGEWSKAKKVRIK